MLLYIKTCTVKLVLRDHLWEKENLGLSTPLKRGSIDLKFYMSGQEKGDPLIQVTA
jgi:hypothetical protein